MMRIRRLMGRGHNAHAAPFLASAFAAMLILATTDRIDGGAIAAAVAMTAAIVVAGLLVPWDHLPAAMRLVPPLAFIGVVAFLQASFTGGGTTVQIFLLLVILWTAIYHETGHLYVVLAVSTAVALVGRVGADASWQEAAIRIVVVLPAALTIHGFARRVRDAAALARRSSLEDPLTGVPNRRRLEIELDGALRRAQRYDEPFTLLMLDLDRFKVFNDVHGHAAGDLLLRDAAAAWTAVVRDVDLVARYGGEEFVIVVRGEVEPALSVARRLGDAIPRGQTCSIGVTEWRRSDSADDLLARADAAMYRAKEAGRNRICVDAEAVSCAL